MEKGQQQTGRTSKGLGRTRMLVAAVLGALLLNPPLLEIFSVDPSVRVMGSSLLLFYINLVWGLLILMVVLPKLTRLIMRIGRRINPPKSGMN